jgi:DNA-binding NarL/FixJ family response regulator
MFSTLTPRELEVLELLSEGKSNRQIALALGIRPDTVTHHVTEVLTKLNVENRAAAAARYVEWRLATPPESAMDEPPANA